MVHKHGNFAFKEPPFKDNDVVEGGNYCQLRPGTEICKDVVNLTIHNGAFTNCKPQPSWVIKGGNWCQWDFCTHERPEFMTIEKDPDTGEATGLRRCPIDCRHRRFIEKQWQNITERQFRRFKRLEREGKPIPEIRVVRPADDEDGVPPEPEFQAKRLLYRHRILRNLR